MGAGRARSYLNRGAATGYEVTYHCKPCLCSVLTKIYAYR